MFGTMYYGQQGTRILSARCVSNTGYFAYWDNKYETREEADTRIIVNE